jgi:hypothetical protein
MVGFEFGLKLAPCPDMNLNLFASKQACVGCWLSYELEA